MRFLKDVWMKGEPVSAAETVNINGMQAATGYFNGKVNGKSMRIRLMAIRWSDNQIARFQIAMPPNLSAGEQNALKSTTYSFKRMSAREKQFLKPYRLKIVTAKSGDTVVSLSRRMAQGDYKEQRFRVLNGLKPGQQVVANRLYKVVVE